MIVRDEAAVIERCLDSAMHLIDAWVIVDTGSTDDTAARIRGRLGHLPGALYDRTWVDFATNRNELLDLARPVADYLLLLDADMSVIDDGFDRATLEADVYDVEVRGGIAYRMPYLVRSTLAWRYHGATHEYIAAPGTPRRARPQGLALHHHADGGSRTDKFERDLRLLEGAVRADRNDTRSVFYLAQTRQALGDHAGALAAYRRRIELGGWDEEVFWSLYQVGVVLEARGEWTHAAQAYLSAWEFRPSRAEPLFRLAAGYRARAHHQVARLMAERAAGIDLPDDVLFVERWVYDWGVDFELSVALWWTGDRARSIEITTALLARDDVTPEYRDALRHNAALDPDAT